MPRRFSSSRRSVSIPVSARTSAVLPWSMWPAVPTIMFFMGLLAILLLALPAFGQEQTPVFRATTAWVRVDVQVGEKRRVLGDLSKDDFVVYDEGQPQKILYFGRDSEPLDVLLLLDVSGSMRRYLEQMAANARQALAELHDGDRVGVMLFSRRTQVNEELTDSRSQGDRRAQARRCGPRAWAAARGSTPRFSTPPRTWRRAKAGCSAPRPGRRAVVMVTDNMSLNYQSPDDKAIEALLGADTVLNAIVVGGGERPKAVRPGVYVNPDFTPSDVFHIAEETGGEAVKAGHAGVSFRDMMENIRTRYSIQYSAPEAAAAGSFRAHPR